MAQKLRNSTTTLNAQNKRKSRTKFRVLLLFVILAALLTAFLLQGGVTGLAVSMAENALARRKIGTAQTWLAVAKATFGGQARVEFMLARVSRLNGELPQMMEHLVNAHKLGFRPDLLDREQGLANLSAGEMDAALEGQARDWIAELPLDVGLVVDALANGLASQSRFPEAAKLLEDYEKAFPGDAMVNYRFGVMNEHIRSRVKAEKEYSKALEKDPTHIGAAWRLARLKSGDNTPTESIKILQPFDFGKQSLAVKTFLAHCYEQEGDLEKSRELFKFVADKGHLASLDAYRVVDEFPDRFLAASELGVLEVKLGNWEEARKYLEMALKENDRDFVARNSYGQVLRRLGFHEEAEKELARITEERREYDKITVLRDQINQNQNNTAARVQMGKILYKYESERFGLFWVRSALAYDPKCKEAHQFLGEFYSSKAGKATHSNEKQLYEQKASYHFAQLEPGCLATAL